MKTGPSITRTLIRYISLFAFVTVIVLLSSCTGTGSGKFASDVDSTKGLKDFYKKYFDIGVAVSPRNIEGEEGRTDQETFQQYHG